MVLEDKATDWKPVLSSVPHGSQIGPLLFILYINDLTNHVDSGEISLCADDSKLFVSWCRMSWTVCASGMRPGTSNYLMQTNAA